LKVALVRERHLAQTDEVPLLTPQEVADRLGWSVRRVWRRINDGSLRATNLGTANQPRWFIDEDEFNRWYKEGNPADSDDPKDEEQ
jgi:excisionase family DNA binding protein